MPDLKPKLEAASIVLVGKFNPAILNPDWLAARNVIRKEEAADSEVQIITSEVTVFRAAWLELQVTRERFVATTTDPSNYPTLMELVSSIFTLLEYTPLQQMGLNTQLHFQMNSESAWHSLGDRLAPKEPWTDILKGSRDDQKPGLKTLVMEGLREDSESKFVRVTVEPSARVSPGVFVATLEHYELDTQSSAPNVLVLLKNAWEPALKFGSFIAHHILGAQK